MTESPESRPDGITDLPPQEHDIVAADEDRRDREADGEPDDSTLPPVPQPHSFAEALDVRPEQEGGKG